MVEELEVIVGTYEEFLLGYKAKLKDDKYSLLATFATKSHTASIRSIAVSGKYVASGGADDKIIIFDMTQRKEIQILMNHEGTVNTMTFTPDSKHLLSAGDDGKMFATRVGTWKINGFWEKAHDGAPVNYIACHPSGKVVLTLGQDLTARTWNILSGRCVFKTNLKTKEHLGKTAECIEWSPNGDNFILTGLKIIELISIANEKTTKKVEVESKPICACWLSDEIFAVGLEDGKVVLCTIHPGDKEVYTEIDSKRIKSIAYLNNILATASSSGEISLWSVNLESRRLKKISSINIGCRPTCIALLNLNQFKSDYLLTEPEQISETSEIKTSIKPEVSFKNLQRVTIEYEDEEGVGKKDKIEESDDDENNKSGAFVRINKQKKQENNHNKNPKKVKRKQKFKAKIMGKNKKIKRKIKS